MTGGEAGASCTRWSQVKGFASGEEQKLAHTLHPAGTQRGGTLGPAFAGDTD